MLGASERKQVPGVRYLGGSKLGGKELPRSPGLAEGYRISRRELSSCEASPENRKLWIDPVNPAGGSVCPSQHREGHRREHLGHYLRHLSLANGSLMELETHFPNCGGTRLRHVRTIRDVDEHEV